jgi:hypothetical protein
MSSPCICCIFKCVFAMNLSCLFDMGVERRANIHLSRSPPCCLYKSAKSTSTTISDLSSLSEVFQDHPVLPMQFCRVFPSSLPRPKLLLGFSQNVGDVDLDLFCQAEKCLSNSVSVLKTSRRETEGLIHGCVG